MKKNIYILFYLLPILMSCSSQKEIKFNTKIVKGVIIYENEPLPGSNILVKDTKRGTIADIDGKFEINVKENEKLIISYVGFESKQVTITDKNYYEVILHPYKPPMTRQQKRYIKRETRKNGGYYVFPD
jgi:hypothetical protein